MTQTRTNESAIRARRVRFEFPDDLAANWHPQRPEFACAANAVSLMMPYVEPYVVRAMQDQLPHLREREAAGSTRPGLVADVQGYIAQEAQHQIQHRRFNQAIAGQVRGVAVLERWMERVYTRLWTRRDERFRVAYAAASESIAYGVARWVERNHRELFDGADHQVATLYLWHLAEEVEHKSVAYDVYDTRFTSRWPLARAMVVSLLVLAVFTVLGTTLGLLHERRLWHPLAVARLIKWAFAFAFSELPNMFASLMPGHHPSDFTDPMWFELYLLDFEQRTGARTS